MEENAPVNVIPSEARHLLPVDDLRPAAPRFGVLARDASYADLHHTASTIQFLFSKLFKDMDEGHIGGKDVQQARAHPI